MVIRYIPWRKNFEDGFLEKYLPRLASMTKNLNREELERQCKMLQNNQWDTKVFGWFRGAKFACVLQTCIELLLMGLIKIVVLGENSENNISDDSERSQNSSYNSNSI